MRGARQGGLASANGGTKVRCKERQAGAQACMRGDKGKWVVGTGSVSAAKKTGVSAEKVGRRGRWRDESGGELWFAQFA